MFIAAFSTKDRSPVRAVCLYLQLLKLSKTAKLTYGAVLRRTRPNAICIPTAPPNPHPFHHPPNAITLKSTPTLPN